MTPDEQLVGMAGATAKLYVTAALDELEAAHRVFGAALRRIRKTYLGDLSEPDRFAMLRALAEHDD